jgi:thiamine-monophosphate kinase
LGNTVFVSGMIGMAGLGLRLLEGENPTHKKPVLELTQQHMQACIARYQCPEPRVALGQMLQGLAQGCVDISDGLLADARHMAKASGVCIEIDLASIPVLPGVDPLQAATWGDDYELLFTLPAQKEAALFTLSQRLGVKITRIGQCIEHQALNDTSLLVVGGDGQRSVPTRLGYEHS